MRYIPFVSRAWWKDYARSWPVRLVGALCVLAYVAVQHWHKPEARPAPLQPTPQGQYPGGILELHGQDLEDSAPRYIRPASSPR